MEDTLEHAQERTKEFLSLLFAEMRLFRLDPESDSVLRLCQTQAPLLTTVEEHYALREIAASAYTEGAYHYIMRTWNERPLVNDAPAEPQL